MRGGGNASLAVGGSLLERGGDVYQRDNLSTRNGIPATASQAALDVAIRSLWTRMVTYPSRWLGSTLLHAGVILASSKACRFLGFDVRMAKS